MRKITVSCIGLGMRSEIYLSLMKESNEYELISFCDLLENKLEHFSNKFGVNKELCFKDEDEFFYKKRADLCLIGTQDKDHFGHIIKALKTGYKKLLVEKPFCRTLEEISIVEEEAKKANADIYICHVLRYAPAFLKAKEFIEEGKIGRLISIDATERVGFAHYSHSFARGHYRNKEESSPMILAKCCHDLDLLVWYSESLCESLSSIGDLTYFIKANQPQGASNRCHTCKYQDKCYFSTENIYFNVLTWAKEYATYKRPYSDEVLREDLKTNQFGRCVFDCDNDVVDDQQVSITFKNGVKAHLTMTAFTPRCGRRYIFYGTEGEIILDEYLGLLDLCQRNGNNEHVEISTLVSSKAGHGGGDKGLIDNLTKMLKDKKTNSTTKLEYSVESHKMALKAEESRIKNGLLIKLM